MTQNSPVLTLPYIQPSQAQKHVTHNEALRVLDAIVQLSVIDTQIATPPSAPEVGDRYIVPAGATGDWAGQAAAVALREAAGWEFFAPRPGWRADDLATGSQVRFDGNDWQTVGSGAQSVSQIGVNAAADSSNRLAVSSPGTLLSHEGTGHQVKVNKSAATDTASLLFQTNWSGRAEMGTAGSDDFAIKVSADGMAWTEALRVSASDGAVTLADMMTLTPRTVASLPGAATAGMGALAFASDALGGAQLVYSDGTTWRLVADNNAI